MGKRRVGKSGTSVRRGGGGISGGRKNANSGEKKKALFPLEEKENRLISKTVIRPRVGGGEYFAFHRMGKKSSNREKGKKGLQWSSEKGYLWDKTLQ